MMTDSIRSINKPNGLYNKNDYLEYVKRFYSHYVWMVVGKGMTGIGLMSAMNRYFFANHIDLHATWKIMLSSENMMTDIRHLIRNNKPVIISVGPNTPNVFGKQGIRLYLDKDGELVESQKDQVKSHYVVVTGVKTINNQEYLIISSWGKKYYLNYREYREYIDKVGGKITSSLLYIKGTLS
jgi:hypothetical protein